MYYWNFLAVVLVTQSLLFTVGHSCTRLIRLVGGNSSSEGRVEVCKDGAWGTVCDDNWDDNDATVVCRQLHLTSIYAEAYTNAYFGQGTGNIVYASMACTGTESRLSLCDSSSITASCDHSEDASVRCPTSPCTDGDVRLMGGRNQLQGRVEICAKGVWGTVSDDGWGTNDARVVCRQLGHVGYYAQAKSRAFFGRGTGAILMDNVNCKGHEANLLSCEYDPNASEDGHYEDAGVICYDEPATPQCTSGDVRLVGDSNQYQGRVEVCVLGQWGTVSDTNWWMINGNVVCKQLGFAYAASTPKYNAFYGQGSGSIFLNRVRCTGFESRLVDCQFDANTASLSHKDDAGLICRQKSCTTGDLRLTGGSNNMEGTIQVCYGGVWGSVCDDWWAVNDALVVCRQLGFSDQYAIAYSNSHFGQAPSTIPIVMDDMKCTSLENNLVNCTFDAATGDCGAGEEAGVKCYPLNYTPANVNCNNGDIQLVGGYNDSDTADGIVEICVNGQWGTVCDDRFWFNVARVVCRQLNYSDIAVIPYTTAQGNIVVPTTTANVSNLPILMDDVVCTGKESELFYCNYNMSTSDCSHAGDARVKCFIGGDCTHGDIKLVGGMTPLEGRVEVCYGGVWTTITNDYWGFQDARVVCRQLGYDDKTAQALSDVYSDLGSGPILLDNARCTGYEDRLVDCYVEHNALEDYHSEDAGVRCFNLSGSNCTQGDIRLMGGANKYEGRVEVCINGMWGTVADDGWGTPDAVVVCRQLGYSDTYATALSRAVFGQGTGLPILMDSVGCTGGEESLLDCGYDQDAGEDTHAEDAGVQCFQSTGQGACPTGMVRLVNGSTQLEGRVEICIDSVWGTVCDDYWGTSDAKVVCRQLGYSDQIADAYRLAQYGSGNGTILLDNVGCSGNEANLLYCRYDPDTTDCNHREDAGVRCYPGAECSDGEMRLAGSNQAYEGRVEVCVKGVWGTVCHDNWDAKDATVVCRHLLQPTTIVVPIQEALFGEGNGPIQYHNMRCNGSEPTLTKCPHSSYTASCDHSQDVGVICLANSQCSDGSVQLVNGTSSREGRVELCNNGVWGTVCDKKWDKKDATVVCNQLGYPTNYVVAYINGRFGKGTGAIYADSFACHGNEVNLTTCNYDTNTFECTHSRDAGVTCSSKALCSEGALRLVNGSSPSEGRVEVCLNGVWGTVTDDAFGNNDAKVVCRQLGYIDSVGVKYSNAHYGQGYGPIAMDNVGCSGSEAKLINCSYNPNSVKYDSHAEDVGVRCFQPESCSNTGDVRLVNGPSNMEGTVEICLNGTWGTIVDDGWGYQDARVVCRQLNFAPAYAKPFYNAHYGIGTGPLQMDNLHCHGTESSLLNCEYDPDTSEDYHTEDAGVKCYPNAHCTQGTVRLVNGPDDSQGRVEVCISNVWGTISDDGWGNADGKVVCGMLGYSNKIVQARWAAYYGEGTGPLVMDNVACTGNENALLSCHYDHNANEDTHAEDAGLQCYANNNCTQGAIMLVGGSTPMEGTVLLCYNGVWGTVSDDYFGNLDASVVCRQLGYPGVGEVFPRAYFGQGPGRIQLDNVHCTGKEPNLLSCGKDTYTSEDSHTEDVGVQCFNPDNCTDYVVKLVGGPDETQGTVQVCYQGVWGTIADDYWGVNDARVICRQLNFYDGYAQAVSNARFGQGTGPMLLDNVGCSGRETSIKNCKKGFDAGEDSHVEDAGVICVKQGVCTNGDVRLVGGPNDHEGRIEVCTEHVWGTVCSQLWGDNDAQVVCRQLGHSDSNQFSKAVAYAFYGQGTGPIALNKVQCSGTENVLTDCTYTSFLNGCTHAGDAGVQCVPISGCPNGALRLMGGSSAYEGRVEVCIDKVWGTISDDGWIVNDAVVVCRQLGYSDQSAVAFSGAYFGQGTGLPILMDNTKCTGSESSLVQCQYDNNTIEDNHVEDAGVICVKKGVCTNGDVRLVGGPNDHEGRIEVCTEHVWGTVCSQLWGDNDAQVVCRQLGHADSNQFSKAVAYAFYGQGTGPIALNKVQCSGTENVLTNCTYTSFLNGCTHAGDAGVQCVPISGCTNGALRLMGGSSAYEGRVEVCINKVWGTISDDGWIVNDAVVVCRQLGYSDQSAVAFSGAYFGQGTGLPILMDNTKCTGSESSLLQCQYDNNTIEDNHGEDAGVRCLKGSGTPSHSPIPNTSVSTAVAVGVSIGVILAVLVIIVIAASLAFVWFRLQKTRQGRYLSVQSNEDDEGGMMLSTTTGRISLKDTEDDDSDDEPLITDT